MLATTSPHSSYTMPSPSEGLTTERAIVIAAQRGSNEAFSALVRIHQRRAYAIVRAIVVMREGRQLTAAELIRWCRERMTHFKCPSSVVFVDSLPKGGTAKVQKNVLRERYGR